MRLEHYSIWSQLKMLVPQNRFITLQTINQNQFIFNLKGS